VRRRLLLSYLLLALALLVALEVPLAIGYARNEQRDLTTRVERDAVSLASLVDGALAGATPAEREAVLTKVAETSSSYSRDSGARIAIVDADGTLVLDTAEDPAVVTGAAARAFDTRPEIGAALGGEVSTGSRFSTSLGYDLLYVAVPVAAGGEVHGAVRITYPLQEVDERVHRYWLSLLAIGVLAIAGAVVTALLFGRWALRPLQRLLDTARAVRAGDLDARVDDTSGPAELAEVNAEFDRMVDEVSDTIEAQAQFVADASHQLRSPMTGLRLSLEAALHDTPPGQRSPLEGALLELDRLGGIVDGLLVLARDRSDVRLTVVDAAAVARDRIEAWTGLAAERGIALDLATSEAAWCSAVPGSLEQVIDNLVDNALGVAPRGSRIAIDVRTAADPAFIEVRVTDEGPGMDPAELEHAFDRFWQGGLATGSSGLGLAIVRRLVEASGGDVHLEHARGDGRGITAVARLPIASPGDARS